MIGDRFARVCMVCFFIFAFTIPSCAEEEIEDLIDIAESKGKIIGIIEGSKTVYFILQPNEKVIWTGVRGHLGALLTNESFYVISTSSGGWKQLPLNVDEAENGVVSISPYIALLTTGDRAIGFDVKSNRFIQAQLPLHADLIYAEAEKYIAVVITSTQAFGLALETPAFSEILLKVRETIESIRMTASKATVRTSDRLLTFEARGSIWNELKI